MRRTRLGNIPALLAVALERPHMLQLGHHHIKDVGGAPLLLHKERTCLMADEHDNIQSDVTNEENDVREEDIVSDTDADTRDIENIERDSNAENERRFSGIEATLERILGEISSLREAQGIMVENGAVVNDVETDIGHIEEDEFVPPREMDLLI